MHKSAEHVRHDPGAPPMSGAGVSRRNVMNMLLNASVFGAAVTRVEGRPVGVHDPIFDAIEAHKQAIIEVPAAREAFNAVEARMPKDYMASTCAVAEKWRIDSGFNNVEAEYTGAVEHVSDQAQSMLDTPPTTVAGLIALLEYLDSFFDRDDEWEMPDHDWPKVALRLVLKSVRQISATAQSAPAVTNAI